MVVPAVSQLIRVCRALNRLARRMEQLALGGGLDRSGHSLLLTLKPWPQLLDGVDRRVPPGTIVTRALRAQEHLLAQLDGTLPFDPVEAVWALQGVADDAYHWSEPARRLAESLGVDLTRAPFESGRRTSDEVDAVVRRRAARSEKSQAAARQSPDAPPSTAGETVPAGEAAGPRRAGGP